MDVNFNVNHQMVTRTDKEKVVNFSDDYLRLCFDFQSDDWNGCSKFILVFSGADVYRIALVDDCFVVPEELLTTQKLVFSIYGVTQSYRITTPKILLHLLIAGYDENTSDLDVDEFTNDVVEQIYIELDKKVNITDIVDNYYTETEVQGLLSALETRLTNLINTKANLHHIHNATEIQGLIEAINNHIQLESTPKIFQETDVATIKAYCVKNGVPLSDTEVNFYEEFTPVSVVSAVPSSIEIDDTSVISVKVRDENDGNIIIGAEVEFYKITGDE